MERQYPDCGIVLRFCKMSPLRKTGWSIRNLYYFLLPNESTSISIKALVKQSKVLLWLPVLFFFFATDQKLTLKLQHDWVPPKTCFSIELSTLMEISHICTVQYTCDYWALKMWPVHLKNWILNHIIFIKLIFKWPLVASICHKKQHRNEMTL